MTPTDENDNAAAGLLKKWKSESEYLFDFAEGGTVSISKGSSSTEGSFTQDDGWVTVNTNGSEFKFYFSSLGDLYYPAFVTDRAETSTVGRHAAELKQEFVSERFLLVDMQ